MTSHCQPRHSQCTMGEFSELCPTKTVQNNTNKLLFLGVMGIVEACACSFNQPHDCIDPIVISDCRLNKYVQSLIVTLPNSHHKAAIVLIRFCEHIQFLSLIEMI